MLRNEEEKYIECPFCLEKDFDKYGLKIHLKNGYCEEYNNIEKIDWLLNEAKGRK